MAILLQYIELHIVDWRRYLRIEKQLTLSNEFDFDHVLNEMIKSKVNGLSLPAMDKTDLKQYVGVMTLDDRQQIYRKIQELITKYPRVCSGKRKMEPAMDDANEPPKKKIKLESITTDKSRMHMSAKEVADWIGALGPAYKQYMNRFIEDAIDGCLMNELDERSLSEIVTQRIHGKKIMREWNEL
eukprot:507419_1